MKFYKYLIEKQYIQGGMIGFGIASNSLKNIENELETILQDFEIPHFNVINKHISVFKMPDDLLLSRNELIEYINSMNIVLEFNVKKLSLMYGKNGIFIALELEKSDKWKDVLKNINKKFDVKITLKSKPHISIFLIRPPKKKKGVIDKLKQLIKLNNLNYPKTIKIKSIELFDDKFGYHTVDYRKTI